MKQCNWSGHAERGLAPVLKNTVGGCSNMGLRSRVIGARTPIMTRNKQQVEVLMEELRLLSLYFA